MLRGSSGTRQGAAAWRRGAAEGSRGRTICDVDNSAAHRTDRRERPDDLRVQTAESVSMRTTANKGTLTLLELTGLGANRNSRSACVRGGAPQLVHLLSRLFLPLRGVLARRVA